MATNNQDIQTITQEAVGDTTPRRGRGRPVPLSAASGVGKILQPQFPALKAEVAAANPVLELSPEVQNLMAKAGSVTQDMLSGVISKDVEAQVSRISAENALRGGLGGGQAARNLEARDFGMTSMDIQRQGVESARALGEFDAGLQAQRLDYLSKMRGMDLDAAQLRIKDREFRQDLDLRRLQLLSSVTTDYYRLAFGYEAQKKSSQGNLDSLRADVKGTLVKGLSSRLGIRRGG